MTKGWAFGVPFPLDDDQAVVSSVWRRLLADGPEGDKDSLIQTIFTSLDRDHNFLLHYPELYQVSLSKLNLWALFSYLITGHCETIYFYELGLSLVPLASFARENLLCPRYFYCFCFIHFIQFSLQQFQRCVQR